MTTILYQKIQLDMWLEEYIIQFTADATSS